MFLKLIAPFAIVALIRECVSDTATITLKDGKISGFTKLTRRLNRFYTFTGIPYAQPPIGDLRFQAPKPVEKWEGILDTTNFRNICYQVNYDTDMESEDCLFVNVFTPHIICESYKLPVLVYIHGGEFTTGNSWAGPDFFMEHNNVVFVTFNYRLGPFGFLSTGDSVIPGNAGLKDQLLALQWIQDNIVHFCGDTANITIFGLDAGAASVSYHLLSSKSKGLFSKAIIQSGSALSPWAYQRKQKNITIDLASLVSNSNEAIQNSSELLHILLQADARSIDNASYIINQNEVVTNLQIQQGYYFAPVLEVESDEAFITQPMFESFKNGDFNKVPTMIGIAEEEFLGWVSSDTMKWYIGSFESSNFLYAPRDLNADDDGYLAAGREIKDFYGIVQGDNNFYETKEALGVKYFSDNSFTRSIIKQAQLQSEYIDVYFYVFSYDGLMGDYHNTLPGVGNVKHGEEINYLFSTILINSQLDNSNSSLFPKSDIVTQERLVKLWTNFATNGNPTPKIDNLFQNLTWPKLHSYDYEYLEINEDLSIKNHPRGRDTITFWDSIYEKYGVEPFETY